MYGASSRTLKTVVKVLVGLVIAFFCYRWVAYDFEEEAETNKRLQAMEKPSLAGLTVEEARDRLRDIGWDVDAIVGYGSYGTVVVDPGLTNRKGIISEEVSSVDYNVTQGSGVEQTAQQKEQLGSCVINYTFVSDEVLEERYESQYDFWMSQYDYFQEWLASGEERPALERCVGEWRDEIVGYDADAIPLSRERDHHKIAQLASDFASSLGV